MPNPEVRIGQVWSSTDPRYGRRLLRVVGFNEKGFPAWAYTPWRDPSQSVAVMRNTETGRLSSISLDRLRWLLGSRGYRLVEEGHA